MTNQINKQMRHILIIIAIISYTIAIYKFTVYYNYDIKDNIIYGEIKPYEFMNDGDLARVHIHYTDDADEFIDSVTLYNVMPTFDIEHPTIGSIHIDVSAMQIRLRDRGQWIQFESYIDMNNYIASRFPSYKYNTK